MKESYLIPEFRETVRRRFPEKEAELNAAFEKRIAELRADTAGAGGYAVCADMAAGAEKAEHAGADMGRGSGDRRRYCRFNFLRRNCLNA